MTYAVKEIYFTRQGEGAQTGRPAVFLRFAGCNLWTGREADRASALCNFCDTDFVGTDGPGGGRFATAAELAAAVREKWVDGIRRGSHAETWAPDSLRLSTVPAGPTLQSGFVVCTGGEPLLQLDAAAVRALHDAGFEVAVETNGTQAAPFGLDWITVSPKADVPVVLDRGDELKLVYPQDGVDPERFAGLDFDHFFLQPMDGPDLDRNTDAALRYCRAHPRWQLSVQTHKYLGIP
jgi:7-carboxy-7-deazaguanine synthase (Cx14CxxC type)